jgi:hypothetical protein
VGHCRILLLLRAPDAAAAVNALNNLQSRALRARHLDSSDIAARTAPPAQ